MEIKVTKAVVRHHALSLCGDGKFPYDAWLDKTVEYN